MGKPEDHSTQHLRRPLFTPITEPHAIPSSSPSSMGDAGCCFSREWLPYFAPLFEIWNRREFWDGDKSEVDQALDWVAELESMLVGGKCGKSRSPLFDAATLLLREKFQEQYDSGGLAELAPDRPDTFFDEDSGDTGPEIQQRKDALCLACQDYVTQMMFQAFDAILDAGVSVFSGGTVATLVVGVPGAIIVGALSAVWGLSLSVLSQVSVRDAIACCMRDGIEGLAITEANFNAALDAACSVPLSPAGDAVHLFVKETLQNQKNYLAFVKALGAFNDVAETGIIECACDQPSTWCHEFDFTLTDGGFTQIPGCLFGTHVPGTGWRSDTTGTGNESICIQRVFSSTQVTNIECIMSADGALSGPGASKLLSSRLSGSPVDSDNPGVAAAPETAIIDADNTIDEIRINPSGQVAGGGRIYATYLKIEGEGTDPFGTPNC